jgi:hypothetical protein
MKAQEIVESVVQIRGRCLAHFQIGAMGESEPSSYVRTALG